MLLHEDNLLLFDRRRIDFAGLLDGDALDTANWTKANSAIVANAALDPNGRLRADKINGSGSNVTHYAQQSYTFAARPYKFDDWLQAGEVTWAALAANTNKTCYFNLASGLVGTATNCVGEIIDRVANWYRCRITFTPSAGASTVQIFLASGDGGGQFAGSNSQGLYSFGAGIE